MNELKKLSNTIVNYSLKVKKGDRVQITYGNKECTKLIKYLINDIYNNDGIVYTKLVDYEINSLLMERANSEELEHFVKIKAFEVDNYDCFIHICYNENEYEGKDIASSIRQELGKKSETYDDIRINKKRWVLLNYPSTLDAYKAKMKTDEFYDYAMNVMNVDYAQMKENIKPLKELMEKTDKVRIVSPGTDLTFSIKNMPAIPCLGECNIPDGEIYTAPIKTSVNGYITYNTPSPYQGYTYENIRLEFQDGKIVNCSAKDNNEQLEKIFNTDEGARYIGEFSFGINPKVLHPMGDILYDEKIKGSIHFTPGRCYNDCDNGNRSVIHWDLVLIQRDDYGGGEIYLDDKLIRKDGLFVIDELKTLN